MKFSIVSLTATITTVLLAQGTWAQDAQSAADATAAKGVVIVNSNTNTSSSNAVQAVTQQPTTVVEASPIQDSKSEAIRKARQNAEVQTEQKIVEKLEDSRMQDEQKRAERLFGDRLNTNEATATATVIQAPVVAAPVVAAPVVQEVKEEKPAQVTIEKIEIVQPQAKEEVATAPATLATAMPAAEEAPRKMYLGLGLGSADYDAGNVDSSYSLGIVIGRLLPNRVAVEGQFMYSDHNVNTYWNDVYRELNQYDFGAGAKYFFLNSSGSFKPYVGGQITYIYRKYQDRNLFVGSSENTEEITHAVNVGPNIGMDYDAGDNFSIGADFKYNFNFINKRDINYASYGLPEDTKPLEEIDYYTFQVTAKLTF